MSYELLRSTVITSTRKPHRCVCCRQTIPIGDTAYSEASIYEGDFQSFYLCMDCNRDSATILDEDTTGDWNSYEWDQMWEAIFELRSRT